MHNQNPRLNRATTGGAASSATQQRSRTHRPFFDSALLADEADSIPTLTPPHQSPRQQPGHAYDSIAEDNEQEQRTTTISSSTAAAAEEEEEEVKAIPHIALKSSLVAEGRGLLDDDRSNSSADSAPSAVNNQKRQNTQLPSSSGPLPSQQRKESNNMRPSPPKNNTSSGNKSPPPLPISDLTTTMLSSFAKQAWTIVHGVLNGMSDSLNVFRFARYAARSAVIRRMLRDCAVINTILLLGLVALSAFVEISPIGTQGVVAQVWRSVFGIAWIMPMYIATQLLGLRWYEELYRLTAEEKQKMQRAALAALRGGAPDSASAGASSSSASAPSAISVVFFQASEAALKCIVTLLYSILAIVVGLVPGIGGIVSFAMASWLHAFYCFDYRFLSQYRYDPKRGVNAPLPLTTILSLFESFWPYYLGYGSTHIAMRYILERYCHLDLISVLAVCSAVFAINVMTTVDAEPLRASAPAVKLPVLSPLFAWVIQWKLAAGRWILEQAIARSAATPRTAAADDAALPNKE